VRQNKRISDMILADRLIEVFMSAPNSKNWL